MWSLQCFFSANLTLFLEGRGSIWFCEIGAKYRADLGRTPIKYDGTPRKLDCTLARYLSHWLRFIACRTTSEYHLELDIPTELCYKSVVGA